MRVRSVLLSAVVAGLTLAPGVHAAGWVTSAPLSPAGQVADAPQVVVTPTGARVIAWVQDAADGFTPQNVSVRVAPPGRNFGAVQTFAGRIESLRLAVSARGTVALAWVDFAAKSVHIARMTLGQANFVEATPIVAPGGEAPFGLQLAFDHDDAVVPFQSSVDPHVTSIWVARLPGGSEAFAITPGTASGGAVDHSTTAAGQPPVFLVGPSVGVDAAGNVFVSWQKQTEGVLNANGAVITNSVTSVKYAVQGRGGAFGAPATLDTTTDASFFPPEMNPLVAAGGGHAYVVWIRPRTEQDVRFQDVGAGGLAQVIPTTDPFFHDLHAGADSSGTLFVAGDGDPAGGGQAVDAAVVPAGATPTPAARLTPAGIQREIDDLAVAPDGTALVLLDRFSSGSRFVQVFASRRLAGEAFSAPIDVSGLQDDSANKFTSVSAAVAPGGRTLAAWASADNTPAPSRSLHLSEFDTAPPVFGTVAVPARAVAAVRVALSAPAVDALSASTSISWDFGDGSSASGPSVSHVFGAPGTYRVVVTATDSVGNAVSTVRTIVVSPAVVAVNRTRPVISRISLSHMRFRVGRGGTASIAAVRRGHSRGSAPIGTAFRFTLNQRATVTIQIGHRGVVAGTLVRGGKGPGRVSIAFSGRIGRAALAAGGYTATITAINAAGRRSVGHTIRFAVV